MDSCKAAEIIENRIRTLEPKITAKRILGYFWLLDITDSQIIHLALGPDTLIHDFIHNIKNAIFQSSPTSMPNFSFIESNPYLGSLDSAYSRFPYATPVIAPDAYQGIASQCDPVIVADQQKLHCGVANIIPYTDSMPGDHSLHEQFMGVEDSQKAVNSRSLSDYQYTDKTCHYFKRGFCRNGTNCRYLHTETLQESFPPKFVHNSYYGEDQFLSPGSLGKLETEITELLKSRGGHPVSIASLPLMYYEKYGRTLQAEGYLTESQRHGKAGYSLTKLLARLKNRIRLIERPHGQHAVMLVEDYMKYTDIGEERNDIGSIVSGSRQLYMTFPAESIFTEDDVSNYFNNFGPVEDVRIPCQLKRMFGFVTFLSSDTVKLILSEGNPHYICGARVLVKPYIEKSKLVERKYHEKIDGPMYYQSNPIDIDSEFQAGWGSSKLFNRQLGQNQENAIEHETLRLQKLQLARERTTSQSCLGYSMDDLKWLKDHPKFSSEPFIEMFDALNVGSTTDDNCNPKCPVENSADH